MINEKKNVDLVQHFRKLILKDLKPLLSVLSEQATVLNTFTYFFPSMLGLSLNSVINKIDLLYRIEDPERVDKEVVSSTYQTLDEMRVYIESSKAPNELKARSLSLVLTASLALDDYKSALLLVEKIVELINEIKDSLSRSVAIRDVLYSLGSINRLTRRESVDIPEDILGQIGSTLAQAVRRNLVEADSIQRPYIRGRIYANLGFGARMFQTIINRETIAEWFDINQAQRLGLDGLSEAEKTSNWFEKALLLADSSTVLAITGEDTGSLADEKFNEAAELAFRHISRDPKKAAYVIGRIAYDKAFTRFYVDSDKFFYESIAILIETLGLERSISTIKNILKLAIDARYYYVAYEIIKDWILPMADTIQSPPLKARLLATCSHLVFPISMSWANNLARDAMILIRNAVEGTTSLRYNHVLISESISQINKVLDFIPALLEVSYVLPFESRKVFSGIEKAIEAALRTHMVVIKRKSVTIDAHTKILCKNLGETLALTKSIPAFYIALDESSNKLLRELGSLIRAKHPIGQIYDALLRILFAYGVSRGDTARAANIAKDVIKGMFEIDKNMWRFKDEEIISELLAENASVIELASEMLGLLTEVCFKVGGTLSDTINRIIIDLSERMEHKNYTKFLARILSRIPSKVVARRLLMRVINVLVDEKKMQREDISKNFLRTVKNIDPVLAKSIFEELTL